MARFDWYECTFHETDPVGLMRHLERAHPWAVIEPDRALYGYQVGYRLRRGPDVMARVWWQGVAGVHVSCTSDYAHELAPLLREWGPHRVTRVDACEDWLHAGLFDRLAEHFVAYAVAHRITLSQVGDWVRGEARTLYLGSKASAVRLVLYEKGYEQQSRPEWVRLEVRVRPKGRDAGEEVAQWTPGQCFAAARWVVGALEGLGWDHLQARSVGTVYRPSDEERARRALARQYGRVLERWLAESGSLEAFQAELAALMKARRAPRVQRVTTLHEGQA